ncbi:MAG: hypothetical protein OHK93_000028 [Ramalina farinacea]|uniref:DUF6594 domain-containing protein n=1 Tax=Ramalina farinacea TaxID=258253 RepID=A0AA43QGD3_9LECA|nr:hypothetical protein [Ramalina farinacea]
MPSVMGSSSRHRRQSKQSFSSTSSTSPPLSKKTAAPPAALSLTSRYSSPSSRSDVSAGQATPRSIFHTGLRSSRRAGKGNNETVQEEINNGNGKGDLRARDTDLTGSTKENVNVFSFMETDDEPASPLSSSTDRVPPAPSELHGHSTHNLILQDDTSRPSSSSSESDSDSDSPPPIFTSRRIVSPARSPRYSDLEVRAIQDGVQRTWTRASLHSDSGISMHSGSPEQERDSPILQHKYPMIEEHEPPDCFEADLQPRFSEDGGEQGSSPESLAVDGPQEQQQDQQCFRHKHNVSCELPDHPEALFSQPASSPPQPPYLYGSSPSLFAAPAAPSSDLHEMSAPSNHQQRRPSIYELPPKPRRRSHPLQSVDSFPSPSASAPPSQQDRPPKTGYDLLASSIAAHPPSAADQSADRVLRPIYRKFETLNNRMLLHLQDEISELESQLADLDRAIGAEGAGAGVPHPPTHPAPPPASRRQAVRLAGMGNQLEWQRQECLARCFGKLEQYSRALATYARLSRELSPARREDVEKYKKWMEVHTPLVDPEGAFLEDHEDLVTVMPPPSPSSRAEGRAEGRAARTHSHQSPGKLDTIPTIFLTFIALVIVFKFVPGVMARLVVAAMLALGASVAGGMGGKDGWVGGKGRLTAGGGGGIIGKSAGWKRSRRAVLAWMGVVGVLAVVVN